jgi:hypothetical protein
MGKPVIHPPGVTPGEVAAITAMLNPMLISEDVTEGEVVTLPSTIREIFLNLKSSTPLSEVSVMLPSNADPRVGQRVFISSNAQIDQFTVTASDTVFGGSTMYSPGDNFVWVQNDVEIWSRVKS